MKKITKYLIIILVLTSCKNITTKESERNNDSENKIAKAELSQVELITQKILDLPKLQWIYHPEVKGRLPLKVFQTNLIEKDLNLIKFGQKVRILSMSELEKEGVKDYLVIELSIQKNMTIFELTSKVEGVISAGKFIKKNGEWNIMDYYVREN